MYAHLVRIVILGIVYRVHIFHRNRRILTKCPYGYPPRRGGADGRLPPRGQVPNFGAVAKHISAGYFRSLVLDRVVEGARLSWYVFHSANLACFRHSGGASPVSEVSEARERENESQRVVDIYVVNVATIHACLGWWCATNGV